MSAWRDTKVKDQKKNSSFCNAHELMPLEELVVGVKRSKNTRSRRTPSRRCEGPFFIEVLPLSQGHSLRSRNLAHGNLSRETCEKQFEGRTKTERPMPEESCLGEIDYVPLNANLSRQTALLQIFEDTAALIRMIIKGRSPTLRHVSRTHSVALDWLSDRIILDPMVRLQHFVTQGQLADILAKGNSTRDEWNQLLQLNNIMHASVLSRSCCCFRFDEGEAMSKPRMQEQEQGEEVKRRVVKS